MNWTKRNLILFFLTFFVYMAKAGSDQSINLMANGLNMGISIHQNQSASLASLYQWHFTDATLFKIVVRDSHSDRTDTLVSNKEWTEVKVKKHGSS